MPGLRIVTEGEKQLGDAFSRIANLIENSKPLLERIGRFSLERIRFNFEREQAPSGKKWRDITDSWRQFKASVGAPTVIGQFTGATFKSADFDVSGNTLSVGFGTEQAVYFQESGRDLVGYPENRAFREEVLRLARQELQQQWEGR